MKWPKIICRRFKYVSKFNVFLHWTHHSFRFVWSRNGGFVSPWDLEIYMHCQAWHCKPQKSILGNFTHLFNKLMILKMKYQSVQCQHDCILKMLHWDEYFRSMIPVTDRWYEALHHIFPNSSEKNNNTSKHWGVSELACRKAYCRRRYSVL